MLPLDDETKQNEPAVSSGAQMVNNADEEVDGRKNVTYEDDRKLHVRMRRTKSVARAEEITKEAEKARRSQPDKP